MHQLLKKIIPARIRKVLKVPYERWYLRKFTAPTTTLVTNAGVDYELVLDPANGAVDEYIFIHRNWETQLATVIKNHLPIGGTFVDIGANIGAFTFMAAKVVGSAGEVYAFEPLPHLCRQMELSKKNNAAECVHIYNQGCAATAGMLTLHTNPRNIGGSSVVNGIGSGTAVEVETVRLDDVLLGLNRLDILKIDVEGYEYEVIKGAEKLLLKYKPVIVLEFSSNLYNLTDSSGSLNFLTTLKNLGYKLSDIDHHQSITDLESYLAWLGDRQTNILCECV